MDEGQKPLPSELTARDVEVVAGGIAKDSAKTAPIWIIAGFLTQAAREVIGRFAKKGK